MLQWKSIIVGLLMGAAAVAGMVIFISDGQGGAGIPVAEGQFPWHVSVRAGTGTGCGGSLVAQRWVLTAGHCTDLNPTYVRIGSLDHNLGTRFKIARKIRHKLYVAGSGNDPGRNDVALFELELAAASTPEGKEQAIALQKAGTVDMATEDASVGLAVVAGWGCTLPEPTCDGTVLRFVAFTPRYDPKNRCGAYSNLPTSVLCMGGDTASADTADSGGGLTTALVHNRGVRAKVIGVASFKNAGKPTIFTRAACFESWVEACVNGSTACKNPQPNDLPEDCRG